MKNVIKFYLSGFYKKPKGLKKPYNPVLGELFRCYWQHNDPGSKTFYISEQVSHHPPISAFYVTNRKEGFCIYGSVLARSKFYGNSVSAVLEGKVKLVLLNRGEEYVISMPYANCKGILIGKLTMELGGKISIECAKTGYLAELEFKLKPLLGGIEASNIIEGKIKLLKNTVATIKGKWDDEIYIHDKLTNQESLLWCPTKNIIESRLKRSIVPVNEQSDNESERLWERVSDAIKASDQYLATEEKSKIEQKQRELDIDRKSKQIDYETKYFRYDKESNEWMYIYKE
jgi:oxysterol-binding protein-related protein 8